MATDVFEGTLFTDDEIYHIEPSNRLASITGLPHQQIMPVITVVDVQKYPVLHYMYNI